MAQKNPFADFFAQNDFAKLFENYQTSAFDLKALLETQRKNVQAITEANQVSMSNLQTIAQRQTEILSQIVEDNSSLAKELLTEGTPEEKIAKNAKLFKNIYERTVGNMKDLSDMINKSNQEASAIINKRVAATMNEIQSSIEKAPSGKKAA
ncbi:MAG: phasin family protein [Alphaproteobacteria bacterium PRO2]|nr:phasin family protein [Alphaproteobacteria bacterium PRO2]